MNKGLEGCPDKCPDSVRISFPDTIFGLETLFLAYLGGKEGYQDGAARQQCPDRSLPDSIRTVSGQLSDQPFCRHIAISPSKTTLMVVASAVLRST